MADRNIPLVYVVEPSKILSKFICTELEKKGFGTVCFTDGLSVLRKITEESPDCIIADKMLPVIDGTELCAIIKEGSDKSEIPFILISAEDDVLDFWTSAHGANKVIPLSSGNFQELIEETCRQVECKNVETGTFFTDESAPAAGEVSAEAKPLLWTVKAMDKSTFFFSMVRQALPLYNFVDDTDVLVRQLFEHVGFQPPQDERAGHLGETRGFILILLLHDRRLVILLEFALTVQKAGHQEVHDRPEFREPVFNRCSGQGKTVFGVKDFDRFGDSRLRVFDKLCLIKDNTIELNGLKKENIVSDNVI